MTEIIYTTDGSGSQKPIGYTTVPYSSDNNSERVIETTESDLSALFERAQANGETLDADATLADAVANPLAYLDFIIYDETDGLGFDTAHSRPPPPSPSSESESA
jgi:hypothetical protein